MEWNFLFRLDYLKAKGEERNLKGVLFTHDDKLPTIVDLQNFLLDTGYQVDLKDAGQLIFIDNHPQNPVEIRIVDIRSADAEEEIKPDLWLRRLAEQFRNEKF